MMVMEPTDDLVLRLDDLVNRLESAVIKAEAAVSLVEEKAPDADSPRSRNDGSSSEQPS